MKRPFTILFAVTLMAVAVCGATGAPPAAALSFAPHFEVGAGALPYSVAAGDVNGDGKADLVTANALADNVSVLLGDGKGHLLAATGSPFAVGSAPEAVAIGEFNSDGNADLAVANTNGDTVSILLGDGLGGFVPAATPTYATGDAPQAVVVTDFNADTFDDVAVCNTSSDNVTVLLGNGAGVFAPPAGSPFATGSMPTGLVTGDFNGDTFADLATADEGADTVSVLLGTGAGGFGLPAASATDAIPFTLVAADFDADGRLDLATDNVGGNTVSVLMNTSLGGVLSFAPRHDTFAGAMPYSLAGGDFNGDGKADLATITGWLPITSDVTVLLSSGTGGFSAVTQFDIPDYQAMSLAAADFNGGQSDLAIGNFLTGANSVSVLLNTTKSKITSIKPAKGKAGVTVTITGTGFGVVRGKARVFFGGKAATKYVSWSQTKIKVKVPATAAGKVSVTVKTVEGKSNARPFTVL
jgi:hypothetical protein